MHLPKSSILIFLIVGITIALVLLVSLNKDLLKNLNFKKSASSNPSPLSLVDGANKIEAQNQPVGKTLLVKYAFLEKPGYVVVHKADGENIGAIIGNSALLISGESKNVQVLVYDNTTLKAGDVLYATLRFDDGDGKYGTADAEMNIEDTSGKLIQSKFTLE